MGKVSLCYTGDDGDISYFPIYENVDLALDQWEIFKHLWAAYERVMREQGLLP